MFSNNESMFYYFYLHEGKAKAVAVRYYHDCNWVGYCMGIFRTAKDAAAASTTPAYYFAVWILGGFVALCGALTYAEIGSRYPITGGYYKIFAVCYHPSLAFGINCIILISNAASLSGVALIAANTLRRLSFKTHLHLPKQ